MGDSKSTVSSSSSDGDGADGTESDDGDGVDGTGTDEGDGRDSIDAGDGNDGSDAGAGDGIRIVCKVDVLTHDLDVGWTKGALFRFESESAAASWVGAQNDHVDGTLHLTSGTSGSDVIDADFQLYYRPPNR